VTLITHKSGILIFKLGGLLENKKCNVKFGQKFSISNLTFIYSKSSLYLTTIVCHFPQLLHRAYGRSDKCAMLVQ
jgi:hypothetical protein